MSGRQSGKVKQEERGGDESPAEIKDEGDSGEPANITFEHSAIFRLSLEEVVLGDLCDLSIAQQRKQLSQPFEAFGMHWLLSIAKLASSEGQAGTFDFEVMLFSLSVIYRECEGGHPLKGKISIPQLAADGQSRHFDATNEEVCNLIGKNFPADAIQMYDCFSLQLESGGTKSAVVNVSSFDDDECVGGFYGSSWRGMGQILLSNFIPDNCRDGRFIKVTIKFHGTPRALRYVE